MKIELAFPFDFAQVHLALEAPDVICCVLIPGPINIFRLQPSSAFSTCFSRSLSAGACWGWQGLCRGLALNSCGIIHWIRPWSEVSPGLRQVYKIFVSETECGKRNLNIKKHARVHFRDNLTGDCSGNTVFHSCSALLQDMIPSLASPSQRKIKRVGKLASDSLGETPSPVAGFSLVFPSSTGNYWVKDVGGYDWKGQAATSSGRDPLTWPWGPGCLWDLQQNTPSLWYLVVNSAPGSWVFWVQHCWEVY